MCIFVKCVFVLLLIKKKKKECVCVRVCVYVCDHKYFSGYAVILMENTTTTATNDMPTLLWNRTAL